MKLRHIPLLIILIAIIIAVGCAEMPASKKVTGNPYETIFSPYRGLLNPDHPGHPYPWKIGLDPINPRPDDLLKSFDPAYTGSGHGPDLKNAT